MKKTTSININNTLFHIDEDAYVELDGYLKSIENHFANNPEKVEIIRDIEERVAEKFTESGARVITHIQVKNIIDTMGTVEQFSGTEANEKSDTSTASETFTATTSPRRLYRNPDDSVIAGICSGLGVYFNIDVRVIRIVFLISIFFGGLGIIIYLVLLFFIPKAVTSAQKMNMRGETITLSSLSKAVKDKIHAMRSDHK